MKLVSLALLLPSLAAAAILPDTVGAFQRGNASKPTLSDQAIWSEYGLKAAETAAYQSATAKFNATAWQFQDTTGSMAAFQWQRPSDARPSTAAILAAETSNSLLLVYGNHLFSFDGYKPSKEEIDGIARTLHNVDLTVLPVLPSYLPSDGLQPSSERYIVGPATLQKFAPGVSPSVAAFRFGAEAQMGLFHNAKGDTMMAIFNYPTPNIARQQEAEFQKLGGAMAKRSGPLVAVVLNPPDPDYAEKLLSEVKYQAQVTADEYVPTQRDNIGNLVTNAFVLIGILLAFTLVSGLALGGFRALRRHGRKGEDADAMITLHLQEP
ncbi:MAG: DUF6599 family protein [Ignavibacteriota bacterium]